MNIPEKRQWGQGEDLFVEDSEERRNKAASDFSKYPPYGHLDVYFRRSAKSLTIRLCRKIFRILYLSILCRGWCGFVEISLIAHI